MLAWFQKWRCRLSIRMQINTCLQNASKFRLWQILKDDLFCFVYSTYIVGFIDQKLFSYLGFVGYWLWILGFTSQIFVIYFSHLYVTLQHTHTLLIYFNLKATNVYIVHGCYGSPLPTQYTFPAQGYLSIWRQS